MATDRGAGRKHAQRKQSARVARDGRRIAQLVTVVVPTRDEAANVRRFLASLPPAVRLIVVDASDDETPLLVSRLRPANSRVIRDPGGIARARDLGALAATTPWLLFTDVDVVFAPGYFKKLLRLVRDPRFDAWYGPKLSLDSHRAYYSRFSRAQAAIHRLGIPAVSGSNFLVRSFAYHAVDGFDPDLSCNEDSEFGWRLQHHGHRVGFDKGLVVYAADHRRIEHARWHKSLHTAVRCALLYTGLIPRRWRSADWGYWSRSRS